MESKKENWNLNIFIENVKKWWMNYKTLTIPKLLSIKKKKKTIITWFIDVNLLSILYLCYIMAHRQNLHACL